MVKGFKLTPSDKPTGNSLPTKTISSTVLRKSLDPQMNVAREIMRENWEILRKLAE